MSKTRRVALNSLMAMLNMLVNQLISLTVSIKILEIYGPDYHGLNSILSNIMTWVLLLEGGLTTVSVVALFKPFMANDTARCNAILTASKIRFLQIGSLIFLVGVGCAIIYPLFIKTPIPYLEVASIFFIMTCSTCFGVAYSRRFAIMYSVSQQEYISQFVRIIFSILGNAAVFFLAIYNVNYLWIRMVYLVVVLCDGVVLAYIIFHRYPFLDYNYTPPAFEAVKGTGQVVVQKATAVIRSSAPIFYISILLGTTAASIYAVNLYGYNFIRIIIQNIMNATQSGLGQVIAEKNTKEVYSIFRVFEFIVINVILWLMSVAVVITIPFINFYTRNITNVNYIDHFLWLVIPLNISIQLLHIPSGIVMNMHKKFKEDKDFQLVSIGIMLITMIPSGLFWGLHGIMLGVLGGSLVLSVCELYYARRYIFEVGYLDFFRPLISNFFIMGIVIWVEFEFLPKKMTIGELILYGGALASANAGCLLMCNMIIERERVRLTWLRFKKIFV